VVVDAGDASIEGFEVPNVINVNPGDEYYFGWDIVNEGTKSIVFRAIPAVSWSGLKGGFTDKTDNEETMANLTLHIYNGTEYVDPFAPGGANLGPWILEGWGNDLNNYVIYYVGDPVSSGDVVPLLLKIVFDGPLTHNGYQGATLTLKGTVEAVQASNNAPNEYWGVNFYPLLQNIDN
jgi:hypothetical protein